MQEQEFCPQQRAEGGLSGILSSHSMPSPTLRSEAQEVFYLYKTWIPCARLKLQMNLPEATMKMR